MIVSYNFLKELIIGKLPPPEKVAESLTMKSFEVEEVIKKDGDYIFNIDVLPNRAPDCLSHIGVAREVCAIFGLKLKRDFDKVELPKPKIKNNFVVEVLDKNKCKKYCYALIENIKVGESPKWLRQRIESLGMNSINNVVDALNYVMVKIGQPLHAFDADKLFSNKIIVRNSKKGDKIITLDNKEIILPEDVLLICDEKDILAIAGIKGGKKAEVDKSTKRIVIESANFDFISIHRASKKINLHTDASLRFKNNVPDEFAEFGIKEAIKMILELAGGENSDVKVLNYIKKKKSKEIKVSKTYIDTRIGESLPKNKIISILKSLEFFVKTKKDYFVVRPPYFRKDIEIKEDVVEEIARIYGFENIKPSSPTVKVRTILEDEKEKLKNKLCEFFVKNGFYQTRLYSFIGEKEVEKFGLNKNDLVELENPMSENIKYLRNSLLWNLYNFYKENNNPASYLERNLKSIKIFEIDKVYFLDKGKFVEKDNFAGIFYVKDFGVEKMSRVFSRFLFDMFFDFFKINRNDLSFEKIKNNFLEGCDVYIKGKKVGLVGLLKGECFCFEFDFASFVNLNYEKVEPVLSKYPIATRDICVVAPKDELSFNIEKEIFNCDKLIEDIFVKDVYYSENGEVKHVTFTLILRDRNKTLEDKELDLVQEKIEKYLLEKAYKIKK